MATGVVAAPAVNGTHVPSATDLAEYEKLIKLRDLVFSGQHPKLKPLNPSTNTTAQATAANASAPASNSAANASYAPTNGLLNQSSSSRQPNGQLMPAALSGFGISSLEKSPLLIATEQNVPRGSLETAIQQEVKRRATQWPKLDRENILPNFDVDEILHNAQEAVKPVLIDLEKLAAKERPSSQKSDDEQSYYSSQGNDDEMDDANNKQASNATKPCVYYFKGKCNRGNNCKFSHDHAFAAQLKSTGQLTESDRSYANVNAGGPPSKKQKRDDARQNQQQGNTINSVDDPHANAKRRADEQYQKDLARAAQGPASDIASGYLPSYVQTPPSARRTAVHERRQSGRGLTPSRDIPVVRSTISSPLAPQPARVSPLAMRPQHFEMRADGRPVPSPRVGTFGSRQQSPEIIQQTMSRKRRRETVLGDGAQNANARRRVASPDIRVKDEPMSPKPVDAIPRYVTREEVRRPEIVEMYSQGGRVEQRPLREVHYIDDAGRRAASPVVRVISGGDPRRDMRREPELRRVVSERQMVRAESPAMSIREPVYYNEAPRTVHAAPREVYAPRQEDFQLSSRASIAPASEYPSEQRRARSPPPTGNMGPPPVRRIVRDQYGNEFYEHIIAEPRYSVAPESRYAEAYAPRPASRLASVIPEGSRQYQDAPAAQRRPEPEPTSPRYNGFEPQPGARAASVAPAFQGDYASGRPQIVRISEYPRDERYERVVREPAPVYTERPREVYYQDEAPRDGTYRVQSVRPEQVQYVESDERFARQTSVRPPPAGYERVAQSMAPPPPRYEYAADGRGAREYNAAGNGPQYAG